MAILERTYRNIDTRYWNPGASSFPVKNRYTAGVAGQRFFEELKENGTIYGTPCRKCGLTFVPARLYCEQCFARLEEWVDVGVEGTVFASTVVHVAKDGSLKETPAIIAAVKIADGLLMHRLGECEAGAVTPGMPVTAVLKPKAERTGSILDIEYFKPL
jgi:uncharacterized protein